MEFIKDYWQKTVHAATAFWPHLLSALVTLIIGLIVIKVLERLCCELLTPSGLTQP